MPSPPASLPSPVELLLRLPPETRLRVLGQMSTRERQAVDREILATLKANRSLCTDFVGVDRVEPQYFSLCAEIDLTPEADADRVAAAIAFAVDRFMAPPVFNYTLAEGDIAPFTWTQGVVTFAHHSYSPDKGYNPACERGLLGTCDQTKGEANTWHWDNLSVSPAVPFTIIKPDHRSTRTGSNTFQFAQPVPANAIVRFEAWGDEVRVSFDGGPQVVATVRAARAQWTPVWVVVDGSSDGSSVFGRGAGFGCAPFGVFLGGTFGGFSFSFARTQRGKLCGLGFGQHAQALGFGRLVFGFHGLAVQFAQPRHRVIARCTGLVLELLPIGRQELQRGQHFDGFQDVGRRLASRALDVAA